MASGQLPQPRASQILHNLKLIKLSDKKTIETLWLLLDNAVQYAWMPNCAVSQMTDSHGKWESVYDGNGRHVGFHIQYHANGSQHKWPLPQNVFRAICNSTAFYLLLNSEQNKNPAQFASVLVRTVMPQPLMSKMMAQEQPPQVLELKHQFA